MKAIAGRVEADDRAAFSNFAETKPPALIRNRLKPICSVTCLDNGDVRNGLPLAVDDSPDNRAQSPESNGRQHDRVRLLGMSPLRQFGGESVGLNLQYVGSFRGERLRLDKAIAARGRRRLALGDGRLGISAAPGISRRRHLEQDTFGVRQRLAAEIFDLDAKTNG